ncbi:MAG: response regulator transcription factor [Candidatus Omnitrophica bacterium]|jgi:DNA-binding response OmpR family regulator|nr:response regulator transcription factor [Candidatus Omnitrophota bacterium]
MAPNIMIVEDDKNILKLLRYNLEKAGFTCFTTITGEGAFDILDAQSIDLIVLDIMLPTIDGFEVCKRIKKDDSYSHIPVIMLTAKGEEVDKIVGFELGADDYVVKPFSPRELILRIKAIMRRNMPKESYRDILSAGGLKIDIPRHQVTYDDKQIELALMEFKLLSVLIERKGRVQSRDVLLEDVWGIAADVTTRTVDTHIKRLRQRLGKAGRQIDTIRGVGYRFRED